MKEIDNFENYICRPRTLLAINSQKCTKQNKISICIDILVMLHLRYAVDVELNM